MKASWFSVTLNKIASYFYAERNSAKYYLVVNKHYSIVKSYKYFHYQANALCHV